MAVPWPASLQQLVEGRSFSYKFGETVTRSDMDIGPAKVRRRFTRPVNKAQVSILLNDVTEYNTFYTFFNTTINGGATVFELDHPITGVLTEWRFIGTPDIRHLGGAVFSVSMEWEEMPSA